MKNKDIEIQERAVLSRQNILASGKQLFMTKGYYQTNTKEIAQNAGISIGSFYNYYKDKLSLFTEIATQEIRTNYERLRDTLDQVSKVPDNIKEILFNYIKQGFEISVRNRLIYSDLQSLALSNPEILSDINDITASLPVLLYNYVVNTPGLPARTKPEIMASMLYAIVQGISDYIEVPENDEDADIYYKQITDILYWYIYGDQ